MSVYTDFQKFVTDMEASSTFRSWCSLHSGDCAAWETYRTGVLTDTPPPSRASMATRFGDALVDVGVMAIDAGLVAPPPQPPLTAASAFTASGLSVLFTDQSVAGPGGQISAWDIDFGDGSPHGSGPGPWSHPYASANTYTVTLTVTSPDGTAHVSHPVTVTAAATGFFAATSIARPTTLAGTSAPHRKPFTDLAGLKAAIAAAVPGDYIYYNGSGVLHVTSSTAAAFVLSGLQPATPVCIDFGTRASGWGSPTTPNYVSFEFTGSLKYEAFDILNTKNVYIYGGSLNSGTAGSAFRQFGNCDNVWWLDGFVEQAGEHGMALQPIDSHTGAGSSITNCKWTFEVQRYCMNPASDPHGDKGTGYHGCLAHDSGSGHFDNNECYVWAHDPLRPGEVSAGKTWPEGGGGSVIEIGAPNATATSHNNNKYGWLGENCLMVCNGTNPGSTSKQTGGNGANWWGHCVLTNTEVVWAELRNSTGQNSHGTSGAWSSGSPITFQHGRHSNTNKAYPLNDLSSATDSYDRRWGIVYNDCT